MPIARRFFRPSLIDLLGLMLLFLVVAVGSRKLFGDADTATHVATGRFILERHSVPRTDPFAAGPGREWFAHEWLADVVFAAAWNGAGWPGVVWLSALLIVPAHLVLYRHLVRRGDDALASLAAVVAAASAASVHWLARPHLFTVLFVVLAVVLLEDVTAGRLGRRWLAALPLLAAVWANLHGGFLILLPILASYGAGLALEGGPGRALLGPWAAATTASALAMLINPWGYRLIVHLVGFFAARGEALRHTEEFAPPTLADRAGVTLAVFLALCALGIALGYATRRRGSGSGLPRPALLLAFLVTTIMALRSVRDVEIMVVFGAILLADGMTSWIARRTGPTLRAELGALHRREAGGGGGLAAAALVATGVLALTGPFPETGFDPARFPVAMVGRLRAEGVRPGGPVLTPDVWGGYLILEWPEAKVYVDGRWDMRGDALFDRYATLMLARPGWEAILDEAGIGWALLPPESALASALRRDPGWILRASDGTTEAWSRRPAAGPDSPAATKPPPSA